MISRVIFNLVIIHLIITHLINACSILDAVCELQKDGVLKCYENREKLAKYQTIQEALKLHHSVTKISLNSLCVDRNDLDILGGITTTLEFNYCTLGEKVFSPKLGSHLTELHFYGNYSFHPRIFQHVTNLTTLSFNYNYLISSQLTKDLFSEALSNLKTLTFMMCGISNLDGDVFVNLKSLEVLEVFVNPLTEFPKCIEYLPNLKTFSAASTDIQVLKRPFRTVLPNLEFLDFCGGQIKRVENCAFCKFPNLKKISFFDNSDLTWIHENAFGNLLPNTWLSYSSTPKGLELFNIENCSIAVLPEFLLDWSTLKHIELGGNKFQCNCSNAWLIEDIQHRTPAFADNLKRSLVRGHKSELKCHGPEHLKGQLLKDVSTEGCKEMIFPTSESSEILWFLVGIFIGVLLATIFVILLIFQRKNIRKFYLRFQTDSEHIKLQDFEDS